MKEVVNELTGEVIEIPEIDNELVAKEINALIPNDLIEAMEQLAYLERKIESFKDTHKEQIKETFKKYGIKSFKNDYISITYVPEGTRRSVDTNKLKMAGLYDEFCKTSNTKESLRITLKEFEYGK